VRWYKCRVVFRQSWPSKVPIMEAKNALEVEDTARGHGTSSKDKRIEWERPHQPWPLKSQDTKDSQSQR
jgi:hypothetical protein